jgi:hypothetical protein
MYEARSVTNLSYQVVVSHIEDEAEDEDAPRSGYRTRKVEVITAHITSEIYSSFSSSDQ